MFSEGGRDVGFLVENVGWMSGSLQEPDIGFINRISDLQTKCRECRVLLGVETSCRTTILRAKSGVCRYLADPIGLE